MKTIKLMTVVALFATVVLGGARVCRAQVAVASSSKAVVKDAGKVEETRKSWISGSVGSAVTNEYILFGLVQDKDTLIAQPYLNLSFRLYESHGFIDNVTFQLPLWASIHEINKPRPRNGDSTLKDWYEFDISPGFCVSFAKNWTFMISDYIYTSPGDYFSTSHNLNLGLTYNDSELLKAFALHPHFCFLQELDNHSGLATQGDTESQYYEFGITPGYTFAEKSTYPLALTFPTTAGFGTNGFYGQGFGYFSTGAVVSVPLAFIPSAYGSWTASLSGLYYRLGTHSARLTDNPTNTSPGRRNPGGISWANARVCEGVRRAGDSVKGAPELAHVYHRLDAAVAGDGPDRFVRNSRCDGGDIEIAYYANEQRNTDTTDEPVHAFMQKHVK